MSKKKELCEFTEDWYDQKYFADPKGKKFTRPDGSIEHWGYRSKTGDIGGADRMANAWKTMFKPKNMLIVGCGRGTMVAYAREAGIEAYGFDWSKYAIGDKGRFARCKPEWIKCHDATLPWEIASTLLCSDIYGPTVDSVIALDFFEHIYETDLDFVINEMYRVAKKWIFLEIATVDGIKEKGYILKKGEPIPLVEDGRTWAGHVTVQTEEWWIDRLDHEDWMPRRDMVNWFFSLLTPLTIPNWLLNTVLVLERL